MYRVKALGNSWAALHEKLDIYREAKSVEKIKEVEELILQKPDGLSKLLEDVTSYINTYGNLPPATNLYAPLNSIFNYSCSWVGVKTNQRQASQTKEIVDKTLEKCKQNHLLSSFFICDALKEIKKLYAELVKEGKAGGTIGKAMKKAFDDYNIPIDDEPYKAKMKAYF